MNAPFPFNEFRYRVPGPGRRDGGLIEAGAVLARSGEAHDGCQLYYRGLACSVFQPWERRWPDRRPECEYFESRHQLEPLVEQRIPGDALVGSGRRLATGGVALGFYRIAPRD